MFLSEWREFPSAACLAGRKKNLMTARVSMLLKSRASLTCFRACFLPGQAKELSAPRYINHLKPNDPCRCGNAPLTSKRCILYIYSTNMGIEYFKHGVYSPFFFLKNAVCFITRNVFGSCIIHILYTGCAKIKKIIPAPKA